MVDSHYKSIGGHAVFDYRYGVSTGHVPLHVSATGLVVNVHIRVEPCTDISRHGD